MEINIKEIIEGWTKLIGNDLSSEPISKERMEICSACNKLTSKYFCSVCNCYMPAKTRSNSAKCVNGLW